jgi:hypothetical protein
MLFIRKVVGIQNQRQVISQEVNDTRHLHVEKRTSDHDGANFGSSQTPNNWRRFRFELVLEHEEAQEYQSALHSLAGCFKHTH